MEVVSVAGKLRGIAKISRTSFLSIALLASAAYFVSNVLTRSSSSFKLSAIVSAVGWAMSDNEGSREIPAGKWKRWRLPHCSFFRG